MPTIDVYLGDDERERKRRRGKWLLPLLAGLIAAFALGREKTPVASPPKPVVAPTPVARAPVVIEVPPAVPTLIETPPGAPPQEAPVPPARLAVGPARLDFGDGPLTRGVPAQMATIRNEGGQPLPRITVGADRPFLVTNGCTGEIMPGGECMIAVVFAPQRPGKFAGALKIAAGSERAQIPLRGSVPREVVPPPAQTPQVVAQAPPQVVVSPTPQLPPARMLCFQPPLVRFTTTGRQTITLTNPEPVPIRVVAVLPIGRQGQTVSGYEIEAKKCLRVLKPGKQCEFTVRANELALQTRETMQLTVFYDDPVTGGRRAARFSSACGR